MTGWRIGWACGNPDVVKGLSRVKDNIDSGVFGAVQDAGIEALDQYDNLSSSTRELYHERAKAMYEALKDSGWTLNMPLATFYLWAKPPVQTSSMDAVKNLIEKAGIICTPGSGFGPSGEGFVRFALTKEINRLEEAVDRMKKIKW